MLVERGTAAEAQCIEHVQVARAGHENLELDGELVGSGMAVEAQGIDCAQDVVLDRHVFTTSLQRERSQFRRPCPVACTL